MSHDATFALLNATYRNTKLTAAEQQAYTFVLRDTEPQALLVAAAEWVRSSQWMPKPAELLAIVARKTTNAIPQPLPIAQRLVAVRSTWQLCDGDCGEPTPDRDDCPFCADLAAARSVNAQYDAQHADATPRQPATIAARLREGWVAEVVA